MEHGKLQRIGEIVKKHGYNSILFTQEGAMRYLTGVKHQIGDIPPNMTSPVNAIFDTSNLSCTLIAKQWEHPRLQIECSWCNIEKEPKIPKDCLVPQSPRYQDIIDEIVRPLSNQGLAEITTVSQKSMLALARSAKQLKSGMNGLEVRSIILQELAKFGLDANLVLVSLAGQESFLHPVAASCYHVIDDTFIKLVVGARSKEHIVSQTLMFKFNGEITEFEKKVYHALQEAALEYCDSYRSGVSENEIYKEMQQRFEKIENKYNIDGFAQSAMNHHPGGGTSPLGNRDQMLAPNGKRISKPYTMFAVNPVDTICNFKVEIQGVIMPNGEMPLILNMDKDAAMLVPFNRVVTTNELEAMLPDLFIVKN